MTLWGDRFNRHPLWESVAEARSLVNRLELEPGDRDGQAVLAYVGQVIELLERRRSGSDPLEVVPHMLDVTNTAVAAWIPALDAVLDELWTLDQTVEPTDKVLESLAHWPPLKPARYLSGIQAATESFSAKVRDALATITNLTDGTQSDLELLRQSESQLKADINSEAQRLTDVVEAFERESNALVTKLLNSATSKLELAASRQEKTAKELLEKLRNHEQTAKDTVHATTASAVATDYGKYARNKSIAAWVCDIAAAFVGLVGVATIVYHILVSGTEQTDIGVPFTRFAVSVAALGLAALIGRRAAQHHKEARAAKRTELALRRVGPFTAALHKEDQEEIILDLTERVFIRGDLDVLGTGKDTSFSDRIKAIRERRRAPAEPQVE